MDWDFDLAEMLGHIIVVGVEDQVSAVIDMRWCKTLYITPRVMMQHHNMGLGTWKWHQPEITQYGLGFDCN